MYWQMGEAKADKASHRAEMAVIMNQYHEQNDKMMSVIETNTTALKSLEMEIRRN